jgi:SAM-dependent methyltransferase
MKFSPDVYERIREGCQRSASAVVPIIYDLFEPKKVVDVGGGEGWWARAFMDAGADRALVLDESAPVAGATPVVRDGIEFAHFDAVKHAHWPLEERFDLAVCLETAEHVPEDTADYLVEFLVAAAPVVLFSAAIPGQPGHGHVNCQWPEYWAHKFRAHGLACTDYPRWRFWHDARVEPWYRQNLLLFGDIERFADALRMVSWHIADPVAGVVHPDIWAWKL